MKKVQNFVKIFLILVLIIGSSSNLLINVSKSYVIAGSSSSGDIPPPGGEGSDTGGGSAAGGLYLNYRIPLVFVTGPFGPSLVTITALENETLIIFGFQTKEFEENQAILDFGETLILNPIIETNLRNGSLIQSFTPLQITVKHESTSSTYDNSFSYSVLVMSMWGKNYQSSFENTKAIIVAGFNQTELDIILPSGSTQYLEIPLLGNTLEINIPQGGIIQANGPIGVVFYSVSQTNGTFAYMGIPEYLWGTEYYLYSTPDITGDPLLNGETEIIVSVIGEGENAILETDFDASYIFELPNNQTLKLPNQVLNPGESFYKILTTITNISLAVMYNFTYNGTRHLSSIQYIAPDKMRWAELFFTNLDFGNEKIQSIVLNDSTEIIPIITINGTLYADFGNYTTRNEGDLFSYSTNDSFGLVTWNGSLFSFTFTGIPQAMNWNSSAKLLYPLNLYSFSDNTSTYFPSWYRFPNINVKEILVNPSTPTEFRRLQLDIIIQNNGTIPSAPFWVTVFVNDSLKINKQIDGLDINQTEIILYEEFQGFGIKAWNISVYTDSLSQIFELQEFDNNLEFFVQISRNYNIIYTTVAIGVIVLGYFVYKLVVRIIKQRRNNKTRFDVILSDIEV